MHLTQRVRRFAAALAGLAAALVAFGATPAFAVAVLLDRARATHRKAIIAAA